MHRNPNRTETERRTENVHHFDFIFFVIMKAIDGLSSETIVRLFYKHNTVNYRLLWDNTQTAYKDRELNAVAWNNLYFKCLSAI